MTSFQGIFTPLITPINSDESPDLESMRRLVRFQIERGVDGLWVMGTTGEFASFDEEERAAVLAAVSEAAEGRAPVVANVSDASTRNAIRHARRARALGVDGIAATPPYYYPHSQDELLAHYRAIRDAVDLPLFIYNIPQTVRVRVELSTAQMLAQEGTAAGIKDSQNDLEWFRQLTLFVRQRGLPFALLAGTRSLIDAAVVVGATGAIPSLTNAFPDLCVSTFAAAKNGDFAAASRLEARIIELEGVSSVAAGGCRNGALLGFLKAVLVHRGILKSAAVTRPLRTLTAEETGMVRERVDAILAAAA